MKKLIVWLFIRILVNSNMEVHTHFNGRPVVCRLYSEKHYERIMNPKPGSLYDRAGRQ